MSGVLNHPRSQELMSDNCTGDTLVIEAGKSHSRYLKDLWLYRELFIMLAWRDILVRYKQTIIGIAWSVLRPLLGMIAFTIVFGKIAKLPSGGIEYPLMVFSGMLVWQFFSNTVTSGGESLIGNANLISKVYFPRLVIPSTSMIVSLADTLVGAVVFMPLLIYYHWTPSWRILLLPAFLLLCAAISLGTAYIISSLNVKYRDFRYVIPFAMQLGIYVSPVGFSSEALPEKWRMAFSLNPLTGVIDGVRWALFGTPPCQGSIAIATIFAILILLLGYFSFRRMEREFADFI